jgi:hypothetical protein
LPATSGGFAGPGGGLPGDAGGAGGFPARPDGAGQTGGLAGVLNSQFDAGTGYGQSGFGPAEGQATWAVEPPPAAAPPIAPPAGYHTHVDVDGDGHWDPYTLRGRPDGGVDILVDLNHDGRPDFVGHDYNADGLVDSADYDTNYDGVFDTRMYDDNGDGWMDRAVKITVDPDVNADREGFGPGPVGRNLRLPDAGPGVPG